MNGSVGPEHPRAGQEVSPPSTAYTEELEARRLRLAATARHPGSDFTGAPAPLRARLEQIVEDLRDPLAALAEEIHGLAEVAFEENRSAQAIAELLLSRGLEVELGVHGLATALRSEIIGSAPDEAEALDEAGAPDEKAAPDAPGETAAGGPAATGPTVAVLAEYDALPGLGHACGHNVIAAMGVGAHLALAALAGEDPAALPGRIVLLGTPAEEGHTGKEHMARAGAFDGLDAALMAHPYDHDLADQLWLGRRTARVRFRGRSAHASAQPFMGRNALDAASLMYQGIGLMRQQTPPSDRIHAVIVEGGQRASVIPDFAQIDLYVRSAGAATLRDLSRRVEDVARGAALMTGCAVDVDWDDRPASLPLRTNEALSGRWVLAQRRRGRDPLPRGVVSETLAASTDFGNVSHLVPGIHPVIAIAPPGTALHTREFARAALTAQAREAVVDGAFGLAAAALDVLHDAALREAMRAEFDAAGGPVRVEGYFD